VFILIAIGLTTCHDVNHNNGEKSGSSSGSDTFGTKNATSTSGSGDAADFMSDSRFGRGGGSGTSSWSFPSTTARSRIVETKYGRVQGLSVTLFTNIQHTGRNFPLRNKIVEVFIHFTFTLINL